LLHQRDDGNPEIDVIHGPSQRSGRIIGAALLMAWALAAPLAQAAQGAETEAQETGNGGYEFGRGLRLGDSGVTLGGYATVEYRREQGGSDKLKFSHTSAFVWWEGLERVKVFAELDVLNTVPVDHDDKDRTGGRRVSLERLYLDYTFNDLASVRLGKFLTPIGRWNPMHADPLVWTTTAPLITQTLFPRSVTGAGLTGNVPVMGRALSYWIYGSNGREWRADRAEDPFARVLGGRVVAPLGYDLQLGLSFANYQLASRNGERQQLRGVDLYWSRDRYEVSAEWLHTTSGAVTGLEIYPDGDHDANQAPPVYQGVGASRSTKGGFLQAVVPLVGDLYAVGRVDWLHDPRSLTIIRQEAVGLVWRPNAGTVLKLEALRPHEDTPLAPRSVVASVSVLF
jgi:hypothetical protein